jgi:quercetin dioxygenase-like cupin family protein
VFCKAQSNGYKELLSGICLKTLVFGEKTLFTEFRMEAGSILPKQSHAHEQAGYLIEGRIRLTIGDHVFEAERGDSWCIPGTIEHGAEILERSVAVEVFSPVREDYLPGKVA